MKSSAWFRLMLVVALAMGAGWLATGCGGDDDDDSDAPAADGAADDAAGGDDGAEAADGAEGGDAEPAPAAGNVDVDGTWNGTRSASGGSTQMQIAFDQSGSDLTGGYQDTSGYAGNFTGTIDGDDIEFTLTLTQGAPGEVWTFAGAANASGTQLEGTMTTHFAEQNHNISATK